MMDESLNRNTGEINVKFPWMTKVPSNAGRIVDTLYEKEVDYQGSWQRRGGVGATMMMLRKADRIENISKGYGYDIFAALRENRGGVRDDVEDLVGYLLLILSHPDAQEE